MANQFNLQPTGNEIIDGLQGLQIVADHIDVIDKKIAHVKGAMGLLAARTLLGRQFMISTAQVLGKDPDAQPDDRILYSNGLLFIAELDSFGYLLDHGIPIDSLSLNFLHPEVIGIDDRTERLIRGFTFQVPVLAIESCISAEAA